MITALAIALVVAALATIGWLCFGGRADREAEAALRRRRSAEDRLRAREERAERRRRLGLPDDDERSKR